MLKFISNARFRLDENVKTINTEIRIPKIAIVSTGRNSKISTTDASAPAPEIANANRNADASRRYLRSHKME